MFLAVAVLLAAAAALVHGQSCSKSAHASGNTPQITLTYFDARGRTEAARLAFIVGDIPFMDRRLSWEEFKVCLFSTWLAW